MIMVYKKFNFTEYYLNRYQDVVRPELPPCSDENLNLSPIKSEEMDTIFPFDARTGRYVDALHEFLDPASSDLTRQRAASMLQPSGSRSSGNVDDDTKLSLVLPFGMTNAERQKASEFLSYKLQEFIESGKAVPDADASVDTSLNSDSDSGSPTTTE